MGEQQKGYYYLKTLEQPIAIDEFVASQLSAVLQQFMYSTQPKQIIGIESIRYLDECLTIVDELFTEELIKQIGHIRQLVTGGEVIEKFYKAVVNDYIEGLSIPSPFKECLFHLIFSTEITHDLQTVMMPHNVAALLPKLNTSHLNLRLLMIESKVAEQSINITYPQNDLVLPDPISAKLYIYKTNGIPAYLVKSIHDKTNTELLELVNYDRHLLISTESFLALAHGISNKLKLKQHEIDSDIDVQGLKIINRLLGKIFNFISEMAFIDYITAEQLDSVFRQKLYNEHQHQHAIFIHIISIAQVWLETYRQVLTKKVQ
jgi:hypothetical protein